MPSDSNKRRNNEHDKTRRHEATNQKRKPTNGGTKKVRSGSKSETTQKTQNPKNNTSTKNKKGKQKNRKKHPKLMLALKIMIIGFLLLCVIGAGVVAGIFFGLFGDDFEITKEELKIGAANSVVVDINGGVVANLSGDEKRKVIKLEEMSAYLPKAYVAIEDERFYKHNGVDLKRTAGAIVNTLFKGSSSYGGSTITQQLVKNITDEKDSKGLAGIARKVKEWAKAYQVERMISKDQILELYLNILFVGGEGNLHGVELGAEYYFNKSAKDLSLAECAYMAGINSSPMSYNPFDTSKDNTEKNKNKTKVVLKKMKELGFITNDDEYNAAVAEAEAGLKFEKGNIASSSNYSYHTDAVIDQVVNQVMTEKGISRQLAENYIYSSGLTIYSTVDSSIQTRVEEEYKKEKYIKNGRDKDSNGNKVNEHTQSGMAIVDYKTGNVVAVAGGLGDKQGAGWNRATQMKKQTGSSIKMIADVAPALEEKVITPATVYIDEKTEFGNYAPKNDNEKYGDNGSNAINIRQFIALSRNVPAVKIMKELTPKKSLEYLKKMGLSALDEKDDQVLSLAIGGMTHGASPLEMAAAYGTIANNGVYITPTFYTKVVDASGNTVMTPNQEETRVFSEQTAYLAKEINLEPVTYGRGTATYCAIKGMDVAAKTGTTDHSYDRWLCGYTPYYSAATWFGFDNNEEVRGFGQNPAGQIWDAVMTDIHKNLEGKRFEKPSGIVEQTVCRATGCLATANCKDTYKEIFASNNLPGKCQGHGKQDICSETGKVATQYCSQYATLKTNYYGSVIPKETLNLWKPVKGGKPTTGEKINEVCDVHTKPKEEEKPKEEPKNNTANTNKTNNTTNNTNSSGQKPGEGNTNTGGNTSTNTEKPSKPEKP